jgi:DNA-binding YbaB/EbfC family protein
MAAERPPTFGDMTSSAQEVVDRLVLAQTELAEIEVTGTAGGGLVTVIMRVDGEVTRVAIDQAAVDEGDAEALAALTLTAIRQAIDAAKSVATERVATITSGVEDALGLRRAGGL